MEENKESKKLKALKDYVKMTDELRKSDKKFRIIEVIALLSSLMAGLIPMIIEFDLNKRNIIEIVNSPNFWTFLILTISVIIAIVIFPLLVKKYFKKTSQKNTILKKAIIETYIKALENSNVKPSISLKHSSND